MCGVILVDDNFGMVFPLVIHYVIPLRLCDSMEIFAFLQSILRQVHKNLEIHIWGLQLQRTPMFDHELLLHVVEMNVEDYLLQALVQAGETVSGDGEC